MSRRLPIFLLAPLLLIGFVQSAATLTPSAFAQNSTAASANTEELAAADQKRLEVLEQGFFFKLFPGDPLAIRLQRLEKQVFGVTMHGTLDHRIQTLESSLAESDPGTGKPLAPRNNSEANRLDQKASTPLAPPVASNNNSLGIPAPVLTPVMSEATKSDKVASAENPDLDNTVLHISKERFAVIGKPDAYVRQVTDAMRLNPQEFTLAFERAKAEIQQAKWDRALNDLSDAISSVPNDSELYLARGLVYMRMGNSVLAREDVRQARFHNSQLPKNIDFEEIGPPAKK
jgi:hypothetical protein